MSPKKTLRVTMKTRIHVNQHIIRQNRKEGTFHPALTVKQGKSNLYAHEVTIDGPSRVVYRPNKPLGCGATVWIETESLVEATLKTELE